jgi:hypothetical protein
MKPSFGIFYIILLTSSLISCNQSRSERLKRSSGSGRFIEVSKTDPDYFSYSDGTPYIPLGLNMISPGSRYLNNTDSGLYEMETWMKKLSDNGGNYIRIWLSSPFWDIEDQAAGKYNEEKAQRIDRLLNLARKYNLRVKMTLEHFRSLTLEENPQPWAVKSVYHRSSGGPLDSIRQYLASDEGKNLFINKVDYYKNRYGNDTIIFGWELWNEMNAMKGPEDSIFFSWNELMLNEVKRRFPDNLVMQSLGSFDAERVRPVYKKMVLIPGDEVAQVHRYLDPGADMEVCQAPMDIICSSAVEELESYGTSKPVILAETGAVESRHSGPSRYYALDTNGIILHDILFAPFFSGSAGAGMSWHWDVYIARNDLWYHFKRFSEAVKGIDPGKERFLPSKWESGNLRIYQLQGRNTVLLWLRDKSGTWQSELRDGLKPPVNEGLRLDLERTGINDNVERVEIYDPWKDKWLEPVITGSEILLPDFQRSLVIKITKAI